MVHRATLRIALFGLAASGLVACRESTRTSACEQGRLWRDTLGTRAERERIELQWARVAGRWDSLMASQEGKRKQERATGTLEANAKRYMDSLVVEEGSVGFRSGCVDWSASWATGDFDRMALATAMARVALADTDAVGIGLETDTAGAPRWIRLDLLAPGSGGAGAIRSVRLRLDSLAARLDSTAD